MLTLIGWGRRSDTYPAEDGHCAGDEITSFNVITPSYFIYTCTCISLFVQNSAEKIYYSYFLPLITIIGQLLGSRFAAILGTVTPGYEFI